MKNPYLFFLTMLLILSCGNSKNSNVVEIVDDNSQADDYARLRNPYPETKVITEDLTGKVIILTEKDFIERITLIDNPKGFQYMGRTPCIVELYADWCKPCGYQSELMKMMAPDYQGKVIFYKINIDKAREVAYAFNVKEIPKILYFKPHGPVSSTVGYLNRERLIKAIDDYLLTP